MELLRLLTERSNSSASTTTPTFNGISPHQSPLKKSLGRSNRINLSLLFPPNDQVADCVSILTKRTTPTFINKLPEIVEAEGEVSKEESENLPTEQLTMETDKAPIKVLTPSEELDDVSSESEDEMEEEVISISHQVTENNEKIVENSSQDVEDDTDSETIVIDNIDIGDGNVVVTPTITQESNIENEIKTVENEVATGSQSSNKTTSIPSAVTETQGTSSPQKTTTPPSWPQNTLIYYPTKTSTPPLSETVLHKSVIAGWSKYVVFIIGPEKEKMLGLKSQLIAKSQAFSEIVYSQKEVYHPEYRAASFGIFLKYINSDNLCFAESHVCDLLRLAFVYEIPHIMNKCREFAIATLSLENCLKYHLAAVLYELEDLQGYAFKFMRYQGPAFLHHPSFVELDAITLGSLVGRDDFQVIETDLFIRLLDWVDAECRRLHYPPDKKEFHRRVCGNLFQHVRFAMMTPKEFETLVLPTELLNQRDVEAVNLRFITPWQFWPTLPPYQYIDRPRIVRQSIIVPIYNHVQVGFRRINCSTARESLRFLASQDIHLVGIEFFGPIFNAPITSYRIKWKIENEFMSSYYKTPAETATMLTPHDFEIEFQHPYKINAQIPYKLTVWMEGEITQFALFPVPQAVVVYNNSQICIHFSDNQKEIGGPNFHVNFNTELGESPGIIKSLLFQTVD